MGNIEEFSPGYQRRITPAQDNTGDVILDIRHTISKALHLWSAWSFWGRFPSVEEAKKEHDGALSMLCDADFSSLEQRIMASNPQALRYLH